MLVQGSGRKLRLIYRGSVRLIVRGQPCARGRVRCPSRCHKLIVSVGLVRRSPRRARRVGSFGALAAAKGRRVGLG